MHRADWQPIDLFLGIFLIGWSGYWLLRERTREFAIKRPAEGRAKEINGAHQVPSDLQKRRLYRIAWTAACKVVAVAVALVIGVTVIQWTGEAFREYTGLFLLLLAMMVLTTGALARSVGKLPCRSKVKVIWIALICYLSFISFISFDFVRNELGERYVSGYYSYYDCEDATPDDPCYFSSYRVNGHLSVTIEGLGLLYIVACIACPWAGYRLWQNAQTNIETYDNDAQNEIRAARLRTEAEQGNAEAQEALGFSYCIGAGVPRDYLQAVMWFRKAAEQGNAEAQYRLGLSYYNGEGVPKDYAQAAFWWRKAAEQGEDTAQYNLKYLL
jgi:hypothetical protein